MLFSRLKGELQSHWACAFFLPFLVVWNKWDLYKIICYKCRLNEFHNGEKNEVQDICLSLCLCFFLCRSSHPTLHSPPACSVCYKECLCLVAGSRVKRVIIYKMATVKPAYCITGKVSEVKRIVAWYKFFLVLIIFSFTPILHHCRIRYWISVC